MPSYDCGYIECISCEAQFGPDRTAAIEGHKHRQAAIDARYRLRRSGKVIYDCLTGAPIFFFSTERDAQMCMTLMEAVVI